MQLVPKNCADKTEDVANDESYRDERDCRERFERFNDINWANHVRPENEIEERLRPTWPREKTKPYANFLSMRQPSFQPCLGLSFR